MKQEKGADVGKVKVWVAVAVAPTGEWFATGGNQLDRGMSERLAASVAGPGSAVFVLTAELPIPEVKEIEACEDGD